MKAKLTLFFFLCFALLATPSLRVYGQSAGGHIKKETCSVCGKLKQNCPHKGKHPKCKTCGKLKEQCPYNGKHPKPQPQPTTGTLSIISTPSDAVIKIDGKYMGTTPLTLDKQKAGTYKVTFSAEGYETITKSVTVKAGETDTCSVTLEKKQAPQPVVQQPVVQQPTTLTTTDILSSSAPALDITVGNVTFKMIRVEGKGSPFYIGETEVTQALWEAAMGSNPSYFKGSNRPVEQVSWNECQTFISKLNSITGMNFHLPTEAEWEYAARGGNRSQGYKYSGSNNIDEVAWYISNSRDETHNVMTLCPNELGIYDMSGNVEEWCQESNRSKRVCCGGSWIDSAKGCLVSNRDFNSPAYRYKFIGFRLAM